MNVHAVEVERAARKPLMSGFHALYSVGGFAGAGGMTFALSAGSTSVMSALGGSVVTLVALGLAWPRLLPAHEGHPRAFAAPRGSVLLLAGLAAATFLVEGAILDWSALLLVGRDLVEADKGGVGYMLFAIVMTTGRLTGDRIFASVGNRCVLLTGGGVAAGGIAVAVVAPWAQLALIGFCHPGVFLSTAAEHWLVCSLIPYR